MAIKNLDKKQLYSKKLKDLIRNHKSIILISINNVGSKLIQDIRMQLYNKATILMGKNTRIIKIISEFEEEDISIHKIVPFIKGNCGLVFTNEKIKEIITVILSNKVESIAKIGSIAPNDVIIPAGQTGIEPGQTSFFQSLNISTKILKGQIEITKDVYLIYKGQKVANSECTLLSKLNIKPFKYGPQIESVYTNGEVVSPDVLNLTDEMLKGKLNALSKMITGLGLSIGIPNKASIKHSLNETFTKLLAVSVMTEYTFKESKQIKEMLENPEAFKKPEKEKEKEKEQSKPDEKSKEESEKEESSEEMGMGGLFGNESGSDE